MKPLMLLSCVLALGSVLPEDPSVFTEVPAEALARVAVSNGEVVYALHRDGISTLVAAARGRTNPPDVLAIAPSGSRVMSPALSPGGHRLYFESNVRPDKTESREDTDVWVSDRLTIGWGMPRPLGPPFASPYNEHFPTVDRSGTLCFNSARPGTRGNDIFCGALDGSAPPQPIGAVNSDGDDAAPWLSASGDLLVFASDRRGGLGGWDLYLSRRSANKWSTARNLGAPINSARDEFGVSLSPDATRVFYLQTGDGARQMLTASFPQ